MSFNFKNLILIKTCFTLAFFLISSGPLVADNQSNFKQVEATGRAILIEGVINTSRKRAL